jgi:hypothetical protein
MWNEEELNAVERETEAMLGRLRGARPRAASLELVVRAAREEARSEAWWGVMWWRGVAAVLAMGLVVSVVWRGESVADEPREVVVEAPVRVDVERGPVMEGPVRVVAERAVVARRSGPSQYLLLRKRLTEMDGDALARAPLDEERAVEGRVEEPATLRELWKMVENGAGS